MNYQRPDLLEHIAGAYVLGTLRGPARARFERLCQQGTAATAALHRWEDRLMPLLPVLAPVTPSRQVWARISQRIQSRSSPLKRGMAPWRWALAGTLALSLVVGISIRLFNPPLLAVAAIGQDVARPLWKVSRTPNSAALTIEAPHEVRSNPQLAYELWALPRDGKPAVSLGLMPRNGKVERALTAVQRNGLLGSNRIAVSLEPAGGSPTGQPTGPVLFVAEMRQSG